MWRDKAKNKNKKVIKGAGGQKSNNKITFQNINND